MMKKVLALLIDDDVTQYAFIKRQCSHFSILEVQLDWVDSMEDAKARIDNQYYDVYLIDYQLREGLGTDLILYATQHKQHAPMILLTANESIDTDLEAMKVGASDYLTKQNLSAHTLERSIRYALERRETQLELSSATQQLEALNAEMREDLNHAGKTQAASLPLTLQSNFLKSAVSYIPYMEVSGDTYDFYMTQSGVCNIFIGDATGHGTAAALITMMTKTGISRVDPFTPTNRLIHSLNTRFFQSIPEGMMMSAVYGRISPEGYFTLCNAGHPPVLVFSAKEQQILSLKATGLPLGAFEFPPPYEEIEYQLRDGDRVFFYTDGLFETRNSQDEQYGLPRLMQFIQHHAHQELPLLLEALILDSHVFSEKKVYEDDFTILAFEYVDPYGVGESAHLQTGSNRQELIDHLRKLKKARSFQSVPFELLEQLAPLSTLVEYDPGCEILQQGHSNRNLYILLEGRIAIVADGKKVSELRRMGDIFGELSTLNQTLCSASVVSSTHIKVIAIDIEQIHQILVQESEQLPSVLYRAFAMILGDKLVLATQKARFFEDFRQIMEHINILKQIKQNQYKITPIPQSLEFLISKAIQETPSEILRVIPLNIQPFTDQIVLIDPEVFHQVMIRLLDNAIRFTVEGHVTISVQFESQNLQILIEDTGSGCDPAKIDQIWDPFYTADSSSSLDPFHAGLGLAVAKELIHLHQWTLFLKSQLGLGTTVSLHIPTTTI